jgi:putative N6-adenine-specific DNA methylase
MMPNDPFTKRVRRHVIGPAHTFFAATSPHLETVCFNELKNLSLPLENMHMMPGGIEFKGRLSDCYAANLLLRTSNRILMRIAEFKVTNFRQLDKKLFNIPWELFINPSVTRAYTVTTRHSRLYHKTAIGESMEKCIALRMNGMPADASNPLQDTGVQHMFVRAVEDRFTVSLDTSGELLFKRGLKQHTGKAPIRETLAAAILAYAGYTGKEPLLDPMCGSGTFSLEAAMIARHIPPGWFRTFMFMTWPAFKKAQWEYLKKLSAGQRADRKEPLVFAADQDLSLCRNLEDIADRFGLSDTIKIMHKDFFEWRPADVTHKTGLVVLNPPYGIRMASQRITDDYYNEIIQKLKKDYKEWQMAILVPATRSLKGLPKNCRRFPFYHGGLNLFLVVGNIASI